MINRQHAVNCLPVIQAIHPAAPEHHMKRVSALHCYASNRAVSLESVQWQSDLQAQESVLERSARSDHLI